VRVKNSTIAEQYAIGVAFIGKHPPLSYADNPAKLYETRTLEDKGFWQIVEAPGIPDEKDLPNELRRHSRYQIPVNMMIEILDHEGSIVGAEMTVTENISLSGASVFTSLAADVGTFIRVTSEQYNSTIISVVRGKRLGPDSIPRLHIEFVDHYFPLEGID
jgi:hypothetical protein